MTAEVTYAHSNEDDTMRQLDVNEVYDGASLCFRVLANATGTGWNKATPRPLLLVRELDGKNHLVPIDVPKAQLAEATEAVNTFMETASRPGTLSSV